MGTSFIGQDALPRGLRDNNPGNIRPNPAYLWDGQQSTENNYVVFCDVEHGIRAMGKDLTNKIVKDGLDTIAKYIPKYAPPSDNNATQSYINTVSELSGIPATQHLTPTPLVLFALIKAHIHVEVGAADCGLVTDDMIKAGIALI